MRMNGKMLETISDRAFFNDGFAKGGRFKRTATKITTKYTVKDEKLVSECHELGFDVDAETLIRKPNGHDVKLHGSEIVSLFQ